MVINIYNIIDVVLHRGSLYVCRRCFSALVSYLPKKKALLKNMENAIEKITAREPSISKVNQPSTTTQIGKRTREDTIISTSGN